MSNKRLAQIEKQIQKIKSQLQDIPVMRPGSLTRQYKNRKQKTGAFYQLSYTHKMKSRTEYIRADYLSETRKQIRTYKLFRKLQES